MILPTANFKARLIEIPKAKKDKDSDELVELRSFTVGKRYRVYGIYDSGNGYTDFLVADNDGLFRWVNLSVFRRK